MASRHFTPVHGSPHGACVPVSASFPRWQYRRRCRCRCTCTYSPVMNPFALGLTKSRSCPWFTEFLDARRGSALSHRRARLLEGRAQEASQVVCPPLSSLLDCSHEVMQLIQWRRSHDWECPQCGKMKDQIPDRPLPQTPSQATGNVLGSAEPDIVPTTSEPPPAEAHPPDVAPSHENAPKPLLEPSRHLDRAASPQPRSAEIVPSLPPTRTQQERAPTPIATTPHRHRPRQAPVWLDGLIVAGVAVLVMLLYRKISNPSNLIETVSL